MEAAIRQTILDLAAQPQRIAARHADGMAILRITPRVISVIDYTRGFGHTEEVVV